MSMREVGSVGRKSYSNNNPAFSQLYNLGIEDGVLHYGNYLSIHLYSPCGRENGEVVGGAPLSSCLRGPFSVLLGWRYRSLEKGTTDTKMKVIEPMDLGTKGLYFEAQKITGNNICLFF